MGVDMIFNCLILLVKNIHMRTSNVMKAYLICRESVPHMSWFYRVINTLIHSFRG